MFAATAAGIYKKVEEAMEVMGQGFDAEYQPNAELVDIYEKRYHQYKELGSFTEQQAQDLSRIAQPEIKEKETATA
jgi:L-ribulokinase